MKYKNHSGNRLEEYELKNLKKNYSGDCVIRALSIALEQPYKQTFEDLCTLAMEFGFMPNNHFTYERYLFSKGWVKNKPPKDMQGKKIKLQFWNNKRAIVMTRRHLTAVIDNCVYDTWDTREYCVNSYYTPAGEKQIKIMPNSVESTKNKISVNDSYEFNLKAYEKNIKIFEDENNKFRYGNKSAGTRARKAIIQINKIGKLLRKDIQYSKKYLRKVA